VRYRPGADVVVLYRAITGGDRHDAVLTAGGDGRLPALACDPRHLATAREVDGRSPAATPLSYDAPADALVQWLPLDLELPLLCVAPEVLAGHLLELGIDVGDEPLEPARVSYAPGRRATLRIGDHVLRGYGDEQAFARAVAGWRVAVDGVIGGAPPATLGMLLRFRPAPHSAARPTTAVFEGALAPLRSTVALVMDGTAPPSATQAAHAAGELLRRIHDVRSDALPQHSVQDTLAAARRSADVLCVVDPSLESQLARLLERLSLELPSAGPEVTAHGDFRAGELIRRDGALAVLGLEDASRAAPARDLATYAADAASREDVEAPAVLEALVEGYGARPDALRWHLSAMLLRRAERPFRKLQEDWPARAAELVAASEDALGR
jgi:hypothetical protein